MFWISHLQINHYLLATKKEYSLWEQSSSKLHETEKCRVACR